jgi:hypothetical protein
MPQQTAVDWIIERFLSGDENIMQVMIKAKIMEKDQMYQVWKTSEEWSDGDFLNCKKSFEEYYNETYGK